MPQQYMFMNRPVILSTHKMNIIKHERPLSSMRSISPHCKQFIKGSRGDQLQPAVSLVEYQKSVQDNLISINNNLSDMLKDTISGIDIICQKVRLCLMDTNNSASIIKMNNSKLDMIKQLSGCREDDNIDEAKVTEIIIEENVDEEDNRLIEEEFDCAKDNETQTNIAPKKNSSLMPFFTILNPQTLSAESVGVKSSINSKLALSPENIQKNINEMAKLGDYDTYLTHMVSNINEEIHKYYNDYKEEHKKENKDTRTNNSSPSERQEGQIVNQMECKIKEKIQKFQNKINKNQKDFNEDHLSDNEFLFGNKARKRGAISLGNIQFPCGEVYRKRAITDLNKRLHMQVEANDSLIFFQKLMAKNKKRMRERPQSANDKRSSENSLIKSPMQQLLLNERQNRRKKRSITDLANMYQDSLWFKGKLREEKRAKKESKLNKKLAIEKCIPKTYTVQSVLNVQNKRKSSKHATKSVVSMPNNNEIKIQPKYEISITNNQPLSESEKCKMYWMRTKYAQLSKKKLQYMDILDDITNKDILPLQSEYPRRDQIRIKKEKPKENKPNVKDTYLYKLLYGEGEENKSAWTELLEPTIKCSNDNCQKCSQTEISEKPSKDLDVGKIRRTLSKYIFADDQMQRNQVFTVMPVHVYYDNTKTVSTARRPAEFLPQKLPLLPMKEIKDNVKRAEWLSDTNKKQKPMKVIYDPILRKIEKEIKLVSARNNESYKIGTQKLPTATSWSPKNFSQFCTVPRQSPTSKTAKVDSIDKVHKKLPSKDSSRKSSKTAERYFNKPSEASKEDSTMELNVEKKIQKELEAQTLKLKNIQERKIWENKYGKSIGQKLLNFVEKQPAVFQLPTPKHALPKTIKDPSRQRRMLEQLRMLKQRNDNIQNNIQKAIQVIESKMVSILCKPAESIEAFDEMEKEITQVLSMMKNSEEPTKQEPKEERQGSDIDQISEELFKKLDKILEQPGLTSSAKSSRQNLSPEAKPKRRTKAHISNVPKKSSNMKTVCFSSTSASGEEKFTITAISPKRSKSPKIPTPKIIIPQVTTTDEEFDTINSELRKLRNELKLQGCSDDLSCNILDAIQESEPDSKNNKTPIVNEPVINLALIQQKSAGDATEIPLESVIDVKEKMITESPEEITNSSQDAIASSQEETDQQSSNFDTQQFGSQEIATNEEAPLQECAEISGPYFTPRTSPLVGKRDLEEPYHEVEPLLPQSPEPELPKEEKPLEIPNEDVLGTERENFYENVNKIIERVESVYSQLAQFEDESTFEAFEDTTQVSGMQDQLKIEDIETDAFLTPFMHAVKDIRNSIVERPETKKESPNLCKSPSYFNVLSFLDTLTDFKEERLIEVRTARLVHYAYPCRMATGYNQATTQSQSGNNLSMATANFTKENEQEVPKKFSSCLKPPKTPTNNQNQFIEINKRNQVPSSHTSFITQSQAIEINKMPKKYSGCLKLPLSNPSMSKSKQKVSFLLEKEEKAIQVAICPLHNKSSSSGSLSLSVDVNKKDGQVSAYLDAAEKMPLSDNEIAFQSTSEVTEEITMSMPEQILQNVQETLQIEENKKNIVEIFRSNNSEENTKENNIKVFYDNYKKNTEKLSSGQFNEASILQAKQSKEISITKQDSIDKIFKNIQLESILKQMLEESSLLKPLKDINKFIDTNLLKETIKERQKVCMTMRSKVETATNNNIQEKKSCDDNERESFLKGVYVFVYLLMFTALNLEYKCI